MTDAPLLEVAGLAKSFGVLRAIDDIGFDLWPGEVLAVVGESGSGKSTLLRCLAGLQAPDAGTVRYATRHDGVVDVITMAEPQRRWLARTEWGFVHQNPRDGLRLGVTAGGNIGEPLMAVGERRYGAIRAQATHWLERVEIDPGRIDQGPRTFSGGMQQRLQIARNLVSRPRLVFMDEPTGGLDVSVQARLLDLIRGLVADFALSVILVTHDLGVARLLSHRMLVMHRGRVVESGLTDRLLDDPQHPYSQLLVASILPT